MIKGQQTSMPVMPELAAWGGEKEAGAEVPCAASRSKHLTRGITERGRFEWVFRKN